MLFLKKYLSNFNYDNRYFKRYFIFSIAFYFIPDLGEVEHLLIDSNSAINSSIKYYIAKGIYLLHVCIYYIMLYVCIRLGISLRKIKNDFVGGIKELAIVYLFLIPIILIILPLPFYFIERRIYTPVYIILQEIITDITWLIVIRLLIKVKDYYNKKCAL